MMRCIKIHFLLDFQYVKFLSFLWKKVKITLGRYLPVLLWNFYMFKLAWLMALAGDPRLRRF